jgi:periplasmic divalent cation tolerance protein
MSPLVVLTTLPAASDARTLARELVELRLVACVNIIDRVQSVYRWKGEIEEDGEQLLVMKTTAERVPDLKNALFARHPYEVPEFIVLAIDRIEGPYRDWLLDSVSYTQ